MKKFRINKKKNAIRAEIIRLYRQSKGYSLYKQLLETAIVSADLYIKNKKLNKKLLEQMWFADFKYHLRFKRSVINIILGDIKNIKEEK